MSEQRAPGTVPRLTLGWRMKMALDYGEVTVQEMAEELGMSRGQLSRYLNDHGAPPRRGVLIAWALRTGVDFDWLSTGAKPEDGDDPGGQEVSRRGCNGGTILDFRARRVEAPARALIAA